MVWRKLSRSTKQWLLAVFICLTVGFVVLVVSEYIGLYQSFVELNADLPALVANFNRGFMNDVVLRTIGSVGLVAYSGLVTLAIILIIKDITTPLISISCARVFRFDPHLVNAEKQAEETMEKTFIVRSLPWLLIPAILLFVEFGGVLFTSIYSIMAVVVGISCVLSVILFRRGIVMLEKARVIGKSELSRYQGYSLLRILIAVLFAVLALLCLVTLLNLVADRSAPLFWGNFYHRWESRVDAIYSQYPGLLEQTREEFLSDLSDYATTRQSESSSMVTTFLPTNPFQFIVTGSIMFFAAMGLPFAFFATQHFYGIKRTLVFVLVPILVGLLFWILGFIIRLPQESVILACIAMVIANYLLTFLFQRLLRRK